MADELITYGMVRAKGHSVDPLLYPDDEYAVRLDFESGGSVGLIPGANLSEYKANELVKNSSIPSVPSSMIINFSGVLPTYNYTFAIGNGFFPANSSSIPLLRIQNGVNTLLIPMMVYNSDTGTSQNVSSGSVSIYRQTRSNTWEFRASFSVVRGSSISVLV